jgi:hypothetical protein
MLGKCASRGKALLHLSYICLVFIFLHCLMYLVEENIGICCYNLTFQISVKAESSQEIDSRNLTFEVKFLNLQ